jgi:hypothetical protein
MMDRYELKELLQNGVATVVFEKSNGELREMRCTLQASYLPPQEPQLLQEGVTPNKRAENLNVLSVWDIENNGWRSFRMDSIKNIIQGS